jgi:hypothetical protein
MIMCDVRASGITGEVADSYLVRVEPRANPKFPLACRAGRGLRAETPAGAAGL